MANSRQVEINSSVTDSLYSVHGVVYVILNFYRRIQILRIPGTCADSVYQALFSPHEREPGFQASHCHATMDPTCDESVTLANHTPTEFCDNKALLSFSHAILLIQ